MKKKKKPQNHDRRSVFGSDLGGLIYFEMIYCCIFNRCSRHQQRLPVSHRLSSWREWVKFILPSTVHMWLRYTRADPIEEGAVGEKTVEGKSRGVTEWKRKIKMRADTADSRKHFQTEVFFFTPSKNTYGVTLIPLLSSKQHCNQGSYNLTYIIMVLSAWLW